MRGSCAAEWSPSLVVRDLETHNGRVRNLGSRRGGKQATIRIMFLALFAMRVVEAMFFLGLAGSAVVVIISFVEDAKELFGED
jgi:hypothetical protein